MIASSGSLGQAQSAAAEATPSTPHRAVLAKYCITCHNGRLRTANLALDAVDLDRLGANAETWEKVVRKLRSGAMPPVGMLRPDPATYEALARWLETGLDRAAALNPNHGRPAVHRLNRIEYTNAIRDLLALEIDGPALLPTDESGFGFDNIADVLSFSPGLLERYMSAAQRISRLAIGDPAIRPAVETTTMRLALAQADRLSEDQSFGTRGGTVIRRHFPLDGDYVLRIRLRRSFNTGIIRGLGNREQLDVRLDGTRVAQFMVGGECVGSSEPRCLRTGDTGDAAQRTSEYDRTADAELDVRFPVKAGVRVIAIAFQKRAAVPEGTETVQPAALASSTDLYDEEMAVASVQLEGPLGATGPGETASRRRIFVCRPSGPSDELGCARTILSTLARRAYRRPVTDQEIESLLGFYRTGRAEGSFESGVQFALQGLLVSPNFLVRVERDPANITAGGAYRLQDLELASRLSFFLWSSIPDDELLEVATQGRLKDPAVLERQVRRMLNDRRAATLVSSFADQWLYLRNMRVVAPDPREFPEFDENLREAFQRETTLFLEDQIRRDRSVLDLLRADYTFLNERLARFYGIPGIYGSQFRRVTQRDERRHGLLGHGSILTVTSYSTRTSPVVRGKWLLENLLGAPPPPPPADVPALKENGDSGAPPTSVRARLEEHRRNAVCASCHARMDPLGFALENFNAIGKWRASEAGTPIDATGVLPDGTKFDGPVEFRKALLGHRDEFVGTVTERLLTYALGRGVEYYDLPAVRKIVRAAAADDHRWSSLILGVVRSAPFQMRMAPAAADTRGPERSSKESW
jgi:hypothetical protein